MPIARSIPMLWIPLKLRRAIQVTNIVIYFKRSTVRRLASNVRDQRPLLLVFTLRAISAFISHAQEDQDGILRSEVQTFDVIPIETESYRSPRLIVQSLQRAIPFLPPLAT